MNLDQKSILKLENLYFNEKYKLYQPHYNSFNQFIDDIIYKELAENKIYLIKH